MTFPISEEQTDTQPTATRQAPPKKPLRAAHRAEVARFTVARPGRARIARRQPRAARNLPADYVTAFNTLAEGSSDNTMLIPWEIWPDNFMQDAPESTARSFWEQLCPEPNSLLKFTQLPRHIPALRCEIHRLSPNYKR